MAINNIDKKQRDPDWKRGGRNGKLGHGLRSDTGVGVLSLCRYGARCTGSGRPRDAFGSLRA